MTPSIAKLRLHRETLRKLGTPADRAITTDPYSVYDMCLPPFSNNCRA